MQNKNKGIVRKEEEKKERAAEPTGPQKVALLQSKLDDSVIKISELTDVLSYLSLDYDPERYYEESAKAKQ